jgi:hypothetical protein
MRRRTPGAPLRDVANLGGSMEVGLFTIVVILLIIVAVMLLFRGRRGRV